MINSGAFRSYIEDGSMTGTTIDAKRCGHAIRQNSAYDEDIKKKLGLDKTGEELFFELALEDLRYAADLLRPIYDQTDGFDGWVSLEVSPLIVHDPVQTIAAARELFARARRPNFLIKVPGSKEGLSAIEEAIFAGVPINVALLFSREHYLAAAEAFLRGIERRIDAGLAPNVGSVASVSLNPWDAAVEGKVPEALCGRLGIAMARCIYKAYREFLRSTRWQRAYNHGARTQRLVWVNNATERPETSNVCSIASLVAPRTVNSVSEAGLTAFALHGEHISAMPPNGGDCEVVLTRYIQAGIDIDALAAKLQQESIEAKVRSWFDLLSAIAYKSAALSSNHHHDRLAES
jgi:transaldolase